MSFSTVLVKGPEVAFAEWMASLELTETIETEPMRATIERAFTQETELLLSNEAAEPKVRELKGKIETLKKMVGNFFLHQSGQMKKEDREELSGMARDLSHRLTSFHRIENNQIKAAVKEVNDLARYLIGNLRMLKFLQKKTSDEPDYHYTMVSIRAHMSDAMKFIDDRSNPFCYFTDVVSPFISEEKKISFSSEIQHVTKVHPKFTLFNGLQTVSQFEESSTPTPYYLINRWLVVSTMDPVLLNDVPSALAFKDGDETVIYQVVNDAEPAFPDARQRKEIRKSIAVWNKIQIKKMWALMLTSLVGAVLFGGVGIIALKPNTNTPFLAFVAARALRCIALAFGYLALAAGTAIFRLHSLHEKVMGIDNLGKWVNQLRIFVGNYPLLADKYPPIERFLTPQEKVRVRARIENAKSPIKFPKLCLSLNSFPFQKK
jgi:hypothetical protein